MRVTPLEISRNFLSDIGTLNNDLARFSRQISSGKLLTQLKDSPVGSAEGNLNRVDDIVLFKPLRLDEIERIVDLLTADLRRRLADRNITLELTEPARAPGRRSIAREAIRTRISTAAERIQKPRRRCSSSGSRRCASSALSGRRSTRWTFPFQDDTPHGGPPGAAKQRRRRAQGGPVLRFEIQGSEVGLEGVVSLLKLLVDKPEVERRIDRARIQVARRAAPRGSSRCNNWRSASASLSRSRQNVSSSGSREFQRYMRMRIRLWLLYRPSPRN